MNAFQIARAVRDKIATLTPYQGLAVAPELRLRTYERAKDVETLFVHVLPSTPEIEITDRAGVSLFTHEVLVLVMDRLPARTDVNSDTAYAWAEIRSALVDAIVALDLESLAVTVAVGQTAKAYLVEAEILALIFNDPDADSLFGRGISLQFTD